MTKEDVIKFLEDNLIDHGSETGIFHYQREGDSFDWTMIYGGSAGHIGELGRDATLKELELEVGRSRAKIIFDYFNNTSE